MSLMESKGAISKALKDLMMRWEEVKEIWSDAQSKEFEKTYLVELEQDARTALGAIDHMGIVLMKIESDCR